MVAPFPVLSKIEADCVRFSKKNDRVRSMDIKEAAILTEQDRAKNHIARNRREVQLICSSADARSNRRNPSPDWHISIARPAFRCIFVVVFFGARWNSSTGGESPRVPLKRDRTCGIQVPTATVRMVEGSAGFFPQCFTHHPGMCAGFFNVRLIRPGKESRISSTSGKGGIRPEYRLAKHRTTGGSAAWVFRGVNDNHE